MTDFANKKTNIGSEKLQQPLRRWEDLTIDILIKIFSYVPRSDLSSSVSSVCRSWQLSCWYSLCWVTSLKNFLNFKVIKDVISNEIQLSKENYDRFTVKVTLLLKSILEDNQSYGIHLEDWRLGIQHILIPADLELSDEQLFYLAKRTINLETLILGGSSRIKEGGFAKALSKWKNLKCLLVGEFNYQYFYQLTEEIGKYYSNDSSLYILCLSLPGFHLSHDKACMIVKNLSGVKVLKFYRVFMHRDGIKMILRHFNSVHFCLCFLSDKEGSNAEETTSLWYSSRFSLNFTSKKRDGYLDWFLKRQESTNKSIWREWMNSSS